MDEAPDEEPTAESFLNMAQEYQRAGALLLPHQEETPSPLYFSYTHALELALKAFLRSHGLSAPKRHDLALLFGMCQGKGLRTRSNLGEVVRLLKYENDEHGFRYFVFKGTGRPEIGWLREVVDEVMGIAAEEVKVRPNTTPPRAVMKFTVGKPQPKRKGPGVSLGDVLFRDLEATRAKKRPGGTDKGVSDAGLPHRAAEGATEDSSQGALVATRIEKRGS